MRIPSRPVSFLLAITALLSALGIVAGQSYFERQCAKKAIESTYGIPPSAPTAHPIPIERDGGILIPVGGPSLPR